MPKVNCYVIVVVLFFYLFCSEITIRDRILVSTFHRIEQRVLMPPESKQLFEGAMSGMFKTLDKYSYYTPAADQKDYNDHLDNHYEGIGLISYHNQDKKSIEVVYPIIGSPAYYAGLRSGDQILSVNETKISDIEHGEFSSLIKKLRGTDIELKLLPFGKTESVTVRLNVAPLDRDSVEGDGIEADGSRRFLLETESEIGYIRVTSFSRRTANEFANALRQLYKNHAKGLILDLRNNPGGYFDVAVNMAALLLRPKYDQDVIVSTKYRNGTIKGIHRVGTKSQICTLPMVVLIDGGTASASEILAAALQDYQRATIVGTRSFGKGVVQEIIDLPANSGTYQLSSASYWRPNNGNIHRYDNATNNDEWGVIPDIESTITPEKWQTLAISLIRDRRANIICNNKEKLLQSFIEQIKSDIEKRITEEKKNNTKKNNEKINNNETNKNKEDNDNEDNKDNEENKENKENKDNNENEENETNVDDKETEIPFKLQGTPPYFDPQLDQAIDILKKQIKNENK
ncbi:MAG: S41 family peptidase [Planctomycetaceae bacterium]|jgi:carboxyl-terminal processing protease|nr:S41 family peptidase [Planctomycetaceae bacterium]